MTSKEASPEFERQLYKNGGSLTLVIPQELAKALESEDGTTITLKLFEGKLGLFVAIYNKKQQAKYQKEK